MPTREQIVEIALSWIGTPFMHQQSIKGVAADCEGFIEGVAVEAGFPEVVEPVRNYRRREDGSLMLHLLNSYMDFVTGSESREPPDMTLALPADVLAFCDEDLRQPDIPRHLGYMVERRRDNVLYVAHASERGVQRHRMDLKWLKRIHSVWNFRGLTR